MPMTQNEYMRKNAENKLLLEKHCTHIINGSEISFMEHKDKIGMRYVVKKRMPGIGSEITCIFRYKTDALDHFLKWLQ